MRHPLTQFEVEQNLPNWEELSQASLWSYLPASLCLQVRGELFTGRFCEQLLGTAGEWKEKCLFSNPFTIKLSLCQGVLSWGSIIIYPEPKTHIMRPFGTTTDLAESLPIITVTLDSFISLCLSSTLHQACSGEHCSVAVPVVFL